MNECAVSAATIWHAPPPQVNLSSDAAHVWLASFDQLAAQRDEFTQSLSNDELERAARFRLQQERDRFIATRGWLRLVLSKYLHREPARLAFGYNAYGKPALAARAQIAFNLSHSHEFVLLAIAPDRTVGIDLEYLRPICTEELAALAANFFSPAEQAAWQSLAPGEQRAAFFNCWTRKEAYVKARGEGLALALDSFDVAFRPGEQAALLAQRGDPQAAARWSLINLPAPPGYAAALAVEGLGWELRCFRYPK
jgi:4'-phosphopantetheinyl transferase